MNYPYKRKMVKLSVILLFWTLALPILFSCSRDRKEEIAPAALDKGMEAVVMEKLAGMKEEIELVSFIGEGCPTCLTAVSLYDGIASLHPKVTHRNLSVSDSEEAGKMGISMVPAVAVTRGGDFGIRFYGLPAGLEFEPFIETIRNLSDGTPDLSASAAESLATLNVPINITIFVDPT